jgi:PAS domain S-box-containing protein
MPGKRRRKSSSPSSQPDLAPIDTAPGDEEVGLEVNRLSHELQVHQEELEIQNRQLIESQHLLEQSRDRYASLYDFAPVAYITLCDHGVIRDINLTGATLLGHARDRLIDRPMVLFVSPPYRRHFLDHLARCRKGPREVVSELVLERSDGATLSVELRSSHGPSDQGPRGPVYLSVLIDLSDRQRLEQERERLRDVTRSEQLLRTILQTLPVAVRVVGAQGEALLFNDACRAVWGVAPAEPLPHIDNQKGWEPATGSRLRRDEWPVAQAVRGGRQTLRRMLHLQAFDGTLRIVMQSAIPLTDDGGAVNGAIEVTEDVTKLVAAQAAARQRQEKLEAAFDAAHLSFWDWDIKSDRLVWSGPSERLFDSDPTKPPKPPADFLRQVHPEDVDSLRAAVAKTREGRDSREHEFRVLAPGGQVIWLLAKGRFSFDSGGHPVRMSGVVTDITARKAAEAELLRAKEAAEEASRLRDDFLATVSHELRTPLGAILLWTQLARNTLVGDEDRNRALDTILISAKAQVELVDDLLDISRSIGGKLRLSLATVPLAPAVLAALDSVRPSAENRQIKLDLEIDNTLPPIQMDVNRIHQVAWNLLTNAIKFTPNGGSVRLSVRLHARPGEPPTARLQVSDTGQGIASDFLPHVFDRFRQAESGLTRVHGGLGLGLSIVRELVQMHGGTVVAESPGVGRGATFTVDLPLPKGAVTSEPASGPPTEMAGSLAGRNILLVEDDEPTRMALETILRARGAIVHAVPSAQAALDAFKVAPPDVLISDIAMPVRSGYTLLRGVRQWEADAGSRGVVRRGKARAVPAVALTAHARPEDRDKAMAAGFQAYLTKPVDPAKLVSTIAGLANGKK